MKRKRRQIRIIIWKMILQENDEMCGWFLLAEDND
jgi:hypothetical protein